jgi:hypothetical protein
MLPLGGLHASNAFVFPLPSNDHFAIPAFSRHVTVLFVGNLNVLYNLYDSSRWQK